MIDDDRDTPAVAASREALTEEDIALGSHSPLRTVVTLLVGPLASQTVQAFYGIADSLWVARTIGEEGVAVFGAVFVVELFAVGLSHYFTAGMNVHLAYLFGQGHGQEGSQMYIDFIRLALVLGVILPIIILPSTIPLVKWFGADDHLAGMCLQYMLPVSLCCFFNFVYMLGCGVAMACGRSLVFGGAQVLTFVLKAGVFDPLFLMAFKTGIWGASLATVLSEMVVGLGLNAWIWFGESFPVHCTLKMFLEKVAPESRVGMKVGVPALIANLSYSVPLVFTQKYLNLAATAAGVYEAVVAVWAVMQKVEALAYGVAIACATGVTPAMSYAYGANRLNRVLRLLVYALMIGMIIPTLITIAPVYFPRKVAVIWSSDPDFVDWCARLLPKAFYTALLPGYQYITSGTLQSIHFVVRAIGHAVLSDLLSWPLFSTLLYFTGKGDPERVMWTYVAVDLYSTVISTALLFGPVRQLLAAPPDEEQTEKRSAVLMTLQDELEYPEE